jgi:GGDEF domain-containing protein
MSLATADPQTDPQRLEAAGLETMLERFASPEMLARGTVNVISVAAIRAKSGDRWSRRAEDVWAYTDRRLEEHLSPGDVHHRLNATDFLVAMPSRDAVTAQVVAMRVLEEVLTHFLGEAKPGDIDVKAVTAVENGSLTCATVDPDLLAVMRTQPLPEAPPPNHSFVGVDLAEERKRNPVSFVTGSGLTLRIDFSVEPLISLKHNATAGLRIEPIVTDERSGRIIPARAFFRLEDQELARIDAATVAYGALYLPKAEGRSQPPIILPQSFRTMASRKGRAALISQAGAATTVVKTGVVVELVDAGAGAPPGRLTEVAGLLTSLCRGVMGRVTPGKEFAAAFRDARLVGVTLDAADLAGPDSRIAGQILDFGKFARGLAPVTAVQGLSSSDFFAIAEVAGLSHVSVRAAARTSERPAA